MLQESEGQDTSPYSGMKSHLPTILELGGERSENLLVLSTGIHNYSGTKLGLEFVQHLFALVRVLNRYVDELVLTDRQVFTNSLTLWTSTFDSLGICIDPLVASANHSCDPNAVTVFDGPQLSLRSLRPIAKDGEVFISYIDVTNPFHRRQSELSERFYFTCDCAKCELGPTGPNDDFLQDPAILNKSVIRETFIASDNTVQDTERIDDSDHGGNDDVSNWLGKVEAYSFDLLEQARRLRGADASSLLPNGLRACIDTKLWPEHRQPIPALRQELFLGHLSSDDLEQAFIQGLKLYFQAHGQAYVKNQQPFHPIRVVHIWTLTLLGLRISSDPEDAHVKKLFENQGLDFEPALLCLFHEVEQAVGSSHGSNSTFARAVYQMSGDVKLKLTQGNRSLAKGVVRDFPEQMKVLRRIAEVPDTFLVKGR